MKEYIKITFEDINIASDFFENDKHLDNFLLNVIRYYRGEKLKFTSKNVEKDFNFYKKTMDYILNSRKKGYEGYLKKVNNQSIKSIPLKGVVKGMVKGMVQPNNNIDIYREFAHLKLSQIDYNKLAEIYKKDFIEDVLDAIENYSQNKNYTSLYLTALNWLKKRDGSVKPKKFVRQRYV